MKKLYIKLIPCPQFAQVSTPTNTTVTDLYFLGSARPHVQSTTPPPFLVLAVTTASRVRPAGALLPRGTNTSASYSPRPGCSTSTPAFASAFPLPSPPSPVVEGCTLTPRASLPYRTYPVPTCPTGITA